MSSSKYTVRDVHIKPVWTVQKPDGTIYDLEQLGFTVDDYNGLGAPQQNWLSDNVPQQHGAVDLGFQFRPRLFNLAVSFACADNTAYYRKRAQLLQVFQPSRNEDTLQVLLPDGTHRAIDFRMVGDPFEGGSRWGGNHARGHRCVIACRAADPLFRDIDATVITLNPTQFNISDGVGAFTRNGWSIPINYTAIETTRPTIRLTGSYGNVSITQTANGAQVSIPGYNIATGDYVDFDFVNETAIDNNGVIRPRATGDFSTFELFPQGHVLPDGTITSATNTLEILGVATGANTQTATISYFGRYLGI